MLGVVALQQVDDRRLETGLDIQCIYQVVPYAVCCSFVILRTLFCITNNRRR